MSSLDLFTHTKPIIGVIHLLPLPGAPKFAGEIDPIFERATREAAALSAAGVDGMIIENYNDEPFSLDEPEPEQLALMASAIALIRHQVTVPIGVNVHFNAWRAEIALALACKAQFTRVEVFVDTVVTYAGIVQPCCAAVTRYRKSIGAERVAIWADLHPKFSRNLISTPLQESARMAEIALADAVIITGNATGLATPLADVTAVKEATRLPVLVGSGATADSIADILQTADGAIVGSAFKEDGNVYNQVSIDATRRLIQAAGY